MCALRFVARENCSSPVRSPVLLIFQLSERPSINGIRGQLAFYGALRSMPASIP